MIIFRAGRGIIKENGVAVFTGGRLPPLRERWENRRKNRQFLRKKAYIKIKILQNKNPVNGQNSFHSQGSFYSNIKMIICKSPSRRLTANSYRLPCRGGNLPPAGTRSVSLDFTAHLRGYNRGEAAC